ncbi:MAG: helix-hairpin-helix domain-containing protein [Deltaproteobacteria bacterium]|nr:helix-hairpin-helix domain-containing protein [Deltaproteobacteria bacterium]
MRTTRYFFKRAALLGSLLALLLFTCAVVSWAAPSTPKNDGAVVRKVTEKVNVNTADIDKLTSLPGIGRKTAENIVTHRQSAGLFKSPEDLLKVKGIGEKNLKKFADLISFE